MRAYGHLWWLGLRARAADRVDFTMAVVVGTIFQGSSFAVVLIIGTGWDKVGGWDIGALYLLYAMTMGGHAVSGLLLGGVRRLPEFLDRGTADYLFVRPQPAIVVAATRLFEPSWLGDAAVAVVALCFAVSRGVDVNSWVIVAGTVVSAVVDGALAVLLAAIALRLLRSDGPALFLDVLLSVAARFPLNAFGPVMQTVLTVIPVGFMGYYTISGAMNGASVPTLVLGALVALVMTGLATLAWRSAQSRYIGSGG